MSRTRSAAGGDMATSYGYREVPEQEKQTLVNDVFHGVARRYDLMNDIMSFGMHRAWKDAMVTALNPRKQEGYRLLDVAGGTGDIAFRAIEASGGRAEATVLDINGSMLAVGAERAARRRIADRVHFVEGNAEDLPFQDGRFDAYTIAFGIRNVPHIDRALAEAYRVLRRGGRFLCLEFSEVDMPLLEKAYDAWSFHAIPQIGQAVTGQRDSYQYLVESIRRFPNQADFAALITAAGFSRVKWTNYSGGITALHSGWKL